MKWVSQMDAHSTSSKMRGRLGTVRVKAISSFSKKYGVSISSDCSRRRDVRAASVSDLSR